MGVIVFNATFERVRDMVFNATFNNISVISWLSVLLVEETCCEFESRSGRGVQHYVIKFVSDLWKVGGFLSRYSSFLHQ
jgi:hypothetical protein